MNFIVDEYIKFEPGFDPWFTKDWKRGISKTIVPPLNATFVEFHFDLSDYPQTLFLDAVQFQRDPGWATSFLNHNIPTKPSDITIIAEGNGYQDSLHISGTLETSCTLDLAHPLNGILKIKTKIGGSGVIQYCLQKNVRGIEENYFSTLNKSVQIHKFSNPFAQHTEISFQIPASCYVSLRIYDVTGRLIKTLVDRLLEEGKYKIIWRPDVASGIYFIRLQTGTFATTRGITFLR
jgi:hypothetical protein